jgi:hypothetical protein
VTLRPHELSATEQARQRRPGSASASTAFSWVRALGSRKLLVALTGVGVVLRVAQYAANRSLWIDEADVALNLLSRSFGELTKPLGYGQGAPIGFLFTEEVVTRPLGFSEYALRLFPLVCSLLALLAFAWLARWMLSKPAASLAVLLFAVADGLIYYSSEVKPYAIDVCASVALLLTAAAFAQRQPQGRTVVALGVGGCVMLAFSFPAVFLVASIALTLALATVFRTRRLTPAVGVAVGIWLVGSIAVGVFAAVQLGHLRSGTERFLGVTESSSVGHAVNVFATNLASAVGLLQSTPFNQLLKVALFCAFVGAVSFLRRDPTTAFIVLIPFPLTLLASAAHAYPLSLRTELFLVPSLVLLLAEGVGEIVNWVPFRWRAPVALALAAAVVGGPLYLAATRLAHPRNREELRPVLEFVRDHWMAGDTLYLHHGAQYAFLYYKECGCVRLKHRGRELWPVRRGSETDFDAQAVEAESRAVIVGKERESFTKALRILKGRERIWIVSSHFASPHEEAAVQRHLIRPLDMAGTRLMKVDRPGAHAYLYKLR